MTLISMVRRDATLDTRNVRVYTRVKAMEVFMRVAGLEYDQNKSVAKNDKMTFDIIRHPQQNTLGWAPEDVVPEELKNPPKPVKEPKPEKPAKKVKKAKKAAEEEPEADAES